jgi:transglutaminase-like putative cysteine protease
MTGWELVRARACLADTVVAAAAVLLASAGLIPLLEDLTWVLPAVVMVLVMATLGAASRALAIPLPLVPVIQALGLLLTVTTMVAAEQAWARVVPTSEAWDVIGALVQQGVQDAQDFAAPAPAFPGLVLLVVGGVGLVALATDTLFVSVRAPLLAGLPLLALFGAAAVIPVAGAPWWAFGATAVGWLLILAADQRDRVRAWGGLAPHARVRGMSAAGRRIGLAVIAVASVVGVLVPTSVTTPWRSGDGAGGGTAASGGPVLLDPLVSMRRNLVQSNDTEVLTYRTEAEDPGYLRVTVLEEFDGTTWRPRPGLESGRDRGVPLPANVLNDIIAADEANRVRGGASYTYDIEVTNLENAFLPLPYPVSAVDDVAGLGSGWRLDPGTGVAFSDDRPASGIAYRVAALDPRIEPGQLRDAVAADGDRWPLLNLPGGLDPSIGRLAREVTADADTPYDRALALQRWFTRDGGFTYSTGVRSGADADYLAEFLRERIGYCEQYAAAMAVMARELGIPSRVVVGFTQGAPTDDGRWQVTVRDAHAWPELWFDGVGWARFEPTPRSGGSVQAPDYAPAPAGATDTVNEGRGLTDLGGDGPAATERTVEGSWTSAVAAGVTMALVLVLALLAVPLARRLVHRRRRLHARDDAAVVEGAWSEVGALAVDLGQPWSTTSTPRQVADRLSRGMPATPAAAVQRLRREVERVRYARPEGGAGSAGTTERAEAVRADVRTVAQELRGRVRWQTRLAAYCWPSSERRRQRSSMRSMKPGEDGGFGAAAGAAAVSASAGRAPKAE